MGNVRVFFKTTVTRARYTKSGFFASDMVELGEHFIKTMKRRFAEAKTTRDADAPPLKSTYAKWKVKMGRAPVRDLFLTSRLWRGIRVLKADQNKCTVGFSDPIASRKMAFNQRHSWMWGVSPSDFASVKAWVAERRKQRKVVDGKVVKVEKVA